MQSRNILQTYTCIRNKKYEINTLNLIDTVYIMYILHKQSDHLTANILLKVSIRAKILMQMFITGETINFYITSCYKKTKLSAVK